MCDIKQIVTHTTKWWVEHHVHCNGQSIKRIKCTICKLRQVKRKQIDTQKWRRSIVHTYLYENTLCMDNAFHLHVYNLYHHVHRTASIIIHMSAKHCFTMS